MVNKILVPLLALFAVLLIPVCASAEVKLSNGRFYVSYSDMSYPGGLELRMLRTFQANSQFNGIFGVGWGSEYETYLTFTGYGPVIVHEDGAGASKRFFPQDWKTSFKQVVESVLDAAKRAGTLSNSEEAQKLRLRLMQDPEFLDQQWNGFVSKGLLKSQPLPIGSKLIAFILGYKELTRVREGYAERDDRGGVRRFDERGRLTRIEDANHNFIELTPDDKGGYRTVKDNYGRQMTLIYNDRHLVDKILGQGGGGPDRVATLKYNSNGELIRSEDDKGIVDEFSYVAPHNLSTLHFADKTTWEMTYYGEDNERKIKSVKETDGILTLYKYSSDTNDQHRIVSVEVKDKNNAITSRETHEFFFQVKPSGERWIGRQVDAVNGLSTDTTNDESCGCPRTIKTLTDQVTFDYDAKGRVIRKQTRTDVTVLKWDDAVGEVLYAEIAKIGDPPGSKGGRPARKVVWAKFVYDERGNLLSAEDSAGKKATMQYDLHGRLTQLTLARHIMFRYNKDCQPDMIRVPGLGTINIKYNAKWEISDATSDPADQGEAITKLVSDAFDQLEAINKPAKIDFSR